MDIGDGFRVTTFDGVIERLDQLDADAKAMSADLKVIAGALTALVELMKQAPVMRAQVRTDVPLIRG